MSLFSVFDDPIYFSVRPTRLADQHFALGLTDVDYLAPLPLPNIRQSDCPRYYRPWISISGQTDLGSTLNKNKDKFNVNLDMQQFKPGEITVKVSGENIVTVEGRHEERPDEHGYISRHFVRTYMVPKSHDTAKIDSVLSSDGVLSISVPRLDTSENTSRIIPILQTGRPSETTVESSGQEKGDA